MKPSQRRLHVGTANAVISLLDAAWRQRALGRRADMRGLAQSAMRLAKLWPTKSPPKVYTQGELPFG